MMSIEVLISPNEVHNDSISIVYAQVRSTKTTSILKVRNHAASYGLCQIFVESDHDGFLVV